VGQSTVTLLARFLGLSTSAAELDGEMIGEELQGDHGQDGADVIGLRSNYALLAGCRRRNVLVS
jgi:hypothetical protein